MNRDDVQIGSTLTNGCHAVRITGPSVGGWLGLHIEIDGTGRMTGTPCEVRRDRLKFYRPVPFEWKRLGGSGVAERYVWSSNWRRLEHQLRRA